MARLSMSADEAASKRRQYTRNNREVWKSLGFRMASVSVHDDDRSLLLAEAEVRKALRTIHMVSDPDTRLSTLVQLGRRNLNPCPKGGEMTDWLAKRSNKDNYEEIEDAVHNAKKWRKSFTAARNAIDRTDDQNKQQRLYAKEVAYGNAAAAWWKLAKVRDEVGDVTKKVFDMAKEFIEI